ncbi:MAG TPA: hypothetical protein VGC09_08220 [Rhodopila sp.]
MLIAFHQACDASDLEIAWELLNLLEFMLMRQAYSPGGGDRRTKDSLVAAHERLWLIRHAGPLRS